MLQLEPLHVLHRHSPIKQDPNIVAQLHLLTDPLVQTGQTPRIHNGGDQHIVNQPLVEPQLNQALLRRYLSQQSGQEQPHFAQPHRRVLFGLVGMVEELHVLLQAPFAAEDLLAPLAREGFLQVVDGAHVLLEVGDLRE